MRLSLILLLAVAASACGDENTSGPGAKNPNDVSSSTATTGATASDFTARDIDGKTVRLAEYLGKEPIILDFWATWCQPCVQEFPHLMKLYDENKAKGLVVFGIAMDGPESVANVAPFARRQQLTFPVLLDDDSHVASLYNPKKSAPLTVLIDRTGRISKIREGYNPGDEEFLAQDVAKIVQ